MKYTLYSALIGLVAGAFVGWMGNIYHLPLGLVVALASVGGCVTGYGCVLWRERKG